MYLSLNDPYSFMLVQQLPRLVERFNIDIELFLMYENIEIQNAAKLSRQWAIKDANISAKHYGLLTITQMPSARSLITGQQFWQLREKTLENAINIFKQTWFNEFEEYFAPSTPVMNFQIKNQLRQIKKGHYQSANIFFAGEWYLGLERLYHLEHRLERMNLAKCNEKIHFNAHHLNLREPATIKQNDADLNCYVSLRSPYSYLGWMQVKQLCQHYKLNLRVNIILPLSMRGINVPIQKKKYVLFDAFREAKMKKIPIGRFVEPMSEGIVNAYRLFPFADKSGKSLAYVDRLFKAIYVDGIDLSKESNLKKLCHEIELDYEQAKAYSAVEDWQQITDQNQKKLDALGFWGVPCFTYKDISCWGQDKLWHIEQEVLQVQERPTVPNNA